MLSIIGCGNPNRQDDGAGVYVAQQLLKDPDIQSCPNVQVFDAGTSGMDVMFQARGSDSLIIIDANSSDSEPGSIFKVPGEELENIPDPGYNLHDFRWDNALYAGKRIYKEEFPEDITVYLIEAESLELGIGLSKKVSTAVQRVITKIKDDVSSYQRIR